MIVHEVEQNTPEWHALRVIPTASVATQLVSNNGKVSTQITGLAESLAGDRFAGEPIDNWEGNAATDRGHLFEAEARDAYAFLYDAEPEIVGFITDSRKQYGCSPDSLIGEDGMLEIKCQLKKGHVSSLVYYK